MKSLATFLGLCFSLLILGGPVHAAQSESLKEIPSGAGLPVTVLAAVIFSEVASVNENDHSFTGTVDIRLRWRDSRLKYPPEQTPLGFTAYRNEEAAAKLEQIWTPAIEIANLKGEPSYSQRGLRIFPGGEVEMMQRLVGEFTSEFNAGNFPFDKQELLVELYSRRDQAERVSLEYQQDDLLFSRLVDQSGLGGWTPGLLNMRRDLRSGWYGERFTSVTAALEIERNPLTTIPPIFVPLFASMLIPLLALWLNKSENGIFAVDAFELVNITIGGLFAVIALNFTVNAEYKLLASGDNTVSRLFGMNYLALAICLAVSMVFFRFNLIGRKWGFQAQEVAYRYIVWALPALTFVCAATLLLLAKAG